MDLLQKVAVLMGGTSAEREVSLMSGTGVLQALINKGVNAMAFDPKTQSIEELKSQGFTSAFIALHGRFGEDGTMQGILEHLKIPYTGSGVMASSIAMNKDITKRIWQSYGFFTPKFVMLDEKTNFDEIAKFLGFPLIIKPSREGSSIGVIKVNNIAELKPAFIQARALDSLVMAEQFINGRELTCTVLELDNIATSLPIIEIKAPDSNYDYQNKYFTDNVQYICPAHIDEQTTKNIQEAALKAFQTLSCRGWARVDIMLENNIPYLLEINTSPGMTTHSLVPMAAKAVGIDYDNLVYNILMQAKLDY